MPQPNHPASNPGLPSGAQVFTPPITSGYLPTNIFTPTIAANNLAGQPDDTLTFTGDNFTAFSDAFSDTQFLVYGQTAATNGTFADATIQDPTANGVLATLPASEPAGSMYFVWPVNSQGVGAPVAINQTDAQWIQPTALDRGQTLAVYGRNLDNTNGQAWVYLQPVNGSTGQMIAINNQAVAQITGEQQATLPTANPYQLQFRVPSNLAYGDYQVWVHNGLGGQYGWSEEPTPLTVQPAPAVPNNVENIIYNSSVTDYGPTIATALSNLSSGGILNFSSGVFNINNDTAQAITISASSGNYNLSYGVSSATTPTCQVTYYPSQSQNATAIQDASNYMIHETLPSNDTATVTPEINNPNEYLVTYNNFTNTSPLYFQDLSNLSGVTQAYVVGTQQLIVHPNTIVEGAGSAATVLQFSGNVPNRPDVTTSDVDHLGPNGNGNFDIGTVDNGGWNIIFQNIGLTYNGSTAPYVTALGTGFALVRERSEDNPGLTNTYYASNAMTFDHVELISQDITAIDWTLSWNVVLTNSMILGSNTLLNKTTNAYLYEDTFLQEFAYYNAAITVVGGSNFAMVNCTTENEEDYLAAHPEQQPPAGYFYGEGKFVEFESEASDVYFADNTSVNLGEGGTPPDDFSSGEQVLVDAQYQPEIAQIISATSNTITVVGNEPDHAMLLNGYTTYIDVTAGAGLGEHEKVDSAAYDSSDGQTTITIDSPFAVVPTTGYININQEPTNLVFYQNTLNHSTGANAGFDLASTGFDIYSGQGVVLDGNTVNNATIGIRLTGEGNVASYSPSQLSPDTLEFTEVLNNTLNVPTAGDLHPVGIMLDSQTVTRLDSSFLGLNVTGNTINQTSVSYNAPNDSPYAGAIAIGLPGQVNSNYYNAAPGPGTFAVIEYNSITAFPIGIAASIDPDTLLYKNTITGGPGSPLAIDFQQTLVPGQVSLLLQGNTYVGFGSSVYSGPVPDPGLEAPQSTIYLVSDGGQDVSQTFTVQNSGASSLTWTANTIQSYGFCWLSFSTSGTVGAESSTSNLVTASPNGLLAPGSYWDTFTVTAGDGTQRVIRVNLIVTNS